MLLQNSMNFYTIVSGCLSFGWLWARRNLGNLVFTMIARIICITLREWPMKCNQLPKFKKSPLFCTESLIVNCFGNSGGFNRKLRTLIHQPSGNAYFVFPSGKESNSVRVQVHLVPLKKALLAWPGPTIVLRGGTYHWRKGWLAKLTLQIPMKSLA